MIEAFDLKLDISFLRPSLSKSAFVCALLFLPDGQMGIPPPPPCDPDPAPRPLRASDRPDNAEPAPGEIFPPSAVPKLNPEFVAQQAAELRRIQEHARKSQTDEARTNGQNPTTGSDDDAEYDC